MEKKFKRTTVTSALPYANGPVHIGHLAGVYVPADIYVRYLRLKKEDVVFIGGSDEHGVPITIRAKKEGITPQDVVDRYHTLIKKSFEEFGISFDVYSRTTSKTHHDTASEFFRKLYDKGEFIEKTSMQYYDEEAKTFLADRYITGECPHCHAEGAYGDQCEKCGTSLSPTDLINPKSAISGSQPVMRETKHWYLPLDKHEAWLRQWILEDHKEWRPNVYGQCKSWLDMGLQPRAVSRDLDWGIPVPVEGAEGKVLYVWFDAPIGYISNTKELLPDSWEKWWKDPETRLVHFIGKDNIVFHCIVFPAMLKAEGSYILPDNVPSNEFLNLEGDKISTSRNWAVWLHEYLAEFPGKQDVLRYVLTANAPETKDNDFTWKDFQARNNNELVAVYGNFVNRALQLTKKYFDGVVPAAGELNDYDRISIPSAAYVFYDKKLLYSTSAAGIQVDCVGVRKEVTDRTSKGKICIVNNVSFRIEAGDFVAIVGGSGAGKSTLLDCMNGLRPATEGEIYYDTNNYYENIRSYKDLMGYVPQRDIMHDDLPLAEGLYYTALLRMRTSMLKDEVKNRVREAIADVRLTGSEGVRISSLSGGQRKRASIAMELLADPKVIFLDEPTSGLSPDLDLEMMDLLRDLSRKGRTIVVITHAMENLDKCDKIAFLGKGGRLCYYGAYSDIFRYFNRRSYSRIFATLSDEKNSEFYERKYRATDYYKKLHREFIATYGDLTNTLLPPVTRAKQEESEPAEGEQSAPNGGERTRETVLKHLFGNGKKAAKSTATEGAASPGHRKKSAAPAENGSVQPEPATEATAAENKAPEETPSALPQPLPEQEPVVEIATASAPQESDARKINPNGFDVIPDTGTGGEEYVITFDDSEPSAVAKEAIHTETAENKESETETQTAPQKPRRKRRKSTAKAPAEAAPAEGTDKEDAE